MKVKFKETYEKPIENKKAEKVRRRRWDRWVYLGILILMVASFLRWLFFPWVFDSADGLLLQQQYDVKFAYDIRILDYKIEEDQEVKEGDTLFLYEKYNGQNTTSFVNDSLRLLAKQENVQSNIISLNAQITKRKLLLNDLRKRLSFWKKEQEKKQKLVYLNVITPNELANVDRSIDDISYEISAQESEYKTLLWELQQLKNLSEDSKNIQFQEIRNIHKTMAFISPINGKVDRLRIPSFQIGYKQEIVTSVIHKDYYVRAYIKLEDLKEFKIGDRVTVKLPYNNERLKGKVKKIYSVSELKDNQLPEDVRDDYKLNLVMEILPVERDRRWDSLTVSNIPVSIQKIRKIL